MANFSLLAKLGLDSKAFQTGLKNAQKKVSGFRKSLVGLRGALTGIGFLAAAKKAMDYVAQIEKSSKLAGLASEDFQKFAFATKTVGIEQEKAADILKDVSDKVGDFLSTGAGPMADFFEQIAPKVGVTAEQFRNLNGRDALQLYVSSLEKANVSQNEMTFFMEAIASDASALLPLLKNNSKALNELANKADKLGAVVSDETVKSIKTLKDELSNAGLVALGLVAKIRDVGQQAFEGFFGAIEKVRTGTFVYVGMNDAIDGVTESTNELNNSQRTQIERQREVNRLVAEAIGQIGEQRITIQDLMKLEEGRLKLLRDMKAREQAKVDAQREAFLLEKELQALQLRASGKNEEAKAIEKQIELRRKAIDLSKKYNISLREAALLVEGVEDNKPSDKETGIGGTMRATGGISSLAAIGGGGRVGKLIPVEQKQLDESKTQTKVLNKIEKNTSKQTTSKFK